MVFFYVFSTKKINIIKILFSHNNMQYWDAGAKETIKCCILYQFNKGKNKAETCKFVIKINNNKFYHIFHNFFCNIILWPFCFVSQNMSIKRNKNTRTYFSVCFMN